MLEQLNFLAGIALMLYGIHTLRRGTERLFGSRLRNLLQTATRSNLRGFGAGFLLLREIPYAYPVYVVNDRRGNWRR